LRKPERDPRSAGSPEPCAAESAPPTLGRAHDTRGEFGVGGYVAEQLAILQDPTPDLLNDAQTLGKGAQEYIRRFSSPFVRDVRG
jgi:hypothetical protein